MGHMIEEIARSRGHEIVSIIDVDNRGDFQSEAFRSAEVAIEFTAPAAAYDNVMRCFEAGCKVVSGSTGWYADHEAELRRICAEQGKTILWSSNFSLGVAVFSAVSKYLAKIMERFPDYDVSLTETHHVHKLDAPSGTAITLAEGILSELSRKDKWVKGEAKAPDELGIRSIREGEVPGIHTIRYESEADRIVITHDAKSRRGFALGAVLAAEFLASRQGLFTIGDLFDF